ncbi:KAP family P-loop NTPase fold protein [Sphingobacterium mizutaii]|uniref:KAP family P-loop NTPase fold protein n=1 Tax=Sphingobacterium mizutaii TaxID=1010 RepID=UPI003D97B7B4
MRLEDLIIEQDNPFKNCQLNRKIQADALLKLIPAFDKGGVIALNNKWGTGKTTFIKMFEMHLQNNSFSTIYFNAWENDFEDNPLSALIAEMKDNFPNEKRINEVIKHGSKLFFDVGSKILSHQIEKHLGEGTLNKVVNELNKSTSDIFKEELKEYSQKKESLTEFKKALKNFVSDNTNTPPLIFFIDELDRCRPNYAVKLLECIKHLFSVPNILFILSLDKEQLAYSINGFYGSDKFDSEEYLRRFIDLEYCLPKPSIENFIESIYKKLGIIDELKLKKSNDYQAILRNSVMFYKDMSLRKIEKLITHFCMIFKTNKNGYKLLFLIQFLMYIKFNHNNFYLKILNGKYTLEELSENYYDIYQKDFYDFSTFSFRPFVTLEAQLMISYKEYLISLNHMNLSLFDEQNKLRIPSKINNDSYEILLKSLDGYEGLGFNLDPILKNIELIQ